MFYIFMKLSWNKIDAWSKKDSVYKVFVVDFQLYNVQFSFDLYFNWYYYFIVVYRRFVFLLI